MTQKSTQVNLKYVVLLCAVLAMVAFPLFTGMAADAEKDPETKKSAQAKQEEQAEEESAVDYNTVLSFPITEARLKSFVIAADKINQVNRKWDMLISGAKTDTMAVEYMDLSSEEMGAVMGNIGDITVEQYNEIFKLVAHDDDFKNIVSAFKQYYVVAPRTKKPQVSSAKIQEN